MSSKEAKLEVIASEIIEYKVCSELANHANTLVFGEGSADADIVLIGEAPGKKEDELGRPFVGASGKFLDEMLVAAGLSRADVYITNIVKYRPPSNRDPSAEEKQEFWPYLKRQLAVIKPKIIVTLGRHSMSFFLPDAKISEVHGQAIQVGEYLVVPLYHPAAALYNGSMRQVLIDDFVRLGKLIDNTTA